MDSLLFDIRFQYALHTTSFEEQPISNRTFRRFRRRCLTYETETGINLIYETVKELPEEMASLMNLNGRMKRMDSLMVASNIRKLGRMKLLYTCVSDLVTFLHRVGMDELLGGITMTQMTITRLSITAGARKQENGSVRFLQMRINFLQYAKEPAMKAQILQNPSDPDATYREKAGRQNRGYVANVVESVGDNGAIVTDYRYDKNVHSDS